MVGAGGDAGVLGDVGETPIAEIAVEPATGGIGGLGREHAGLDAEDVEQAVAIEVEESDAATAVVWNILVTSAKTSDQMAYDIVKTVFEKKSELVAVHKDANWIDLRWQAVGSPIPFHPGARKYLVERGVKFAK